MQESLNFLRFLFSINWFYLLTHTTNSMIDKKKQYQNLFNDFYYIEAKLPSISAQRFYLITHTTTPSMIDKTKQQQYQLFINDFYFYFIRCKRGLTSFDFCSKMDNCGCVHLKPNRSGTAWRRTRCLRKTERLASNGSQNSWVIYYFYYYSVS